MVTAHYNTLGETGYLPEPADRAPSEGLDFLWLELTEKCNLQCVHCYAESGPERPIHGKINLDDWLRLLHEAFSLGCRQVQFIGGEPTIYPRLPDLIEAAHSLGYELIEVFTNGTHFTSKLKKTFKACQVSVAFSVYSCSGKVHDAVTLGPGSLTKTLESIRWTLESGLPIRAGIIDVGINSDTVEDTRNFLTELGIPVVGVDRLRGVGKGAVSSNAAESQMDELCGECWKRKLCVTPSGDAFPCVFSRFCPVGNVTEGLANVLKADKLLAFRSKMMSMTYSQEALCYPERSCSPATRCTPEYCNPRYDVCNPKCSPHTCGPNCSPAHGDGNCQPTCKPSYQPFASTRTR